MYEKLVKDLRELQAITELCGEQSCSECENRELCDKHDSKTLSGTYKEAADAIENLDYIAQTYAETVHELEEQNRWIPVTERLPEEKTYVLILTDTIAGKMAKVSFLYKDSEGRNCWSALDVYGKNLFDWQPTHWMPLPEPPEEET